MSKVIQIEPMPREPDATPGMLRIIYALTDDGQIWVRDGIGGWGKIDGPPLPPAGTTKPTLFKQEIGRVIERAHHATDWRNE